MSNPSTSWRNAALKYAQRLVLVFCAVSMGPAFATASDRDDKSDTEQKVPETQKPYWEQDPWSNPDRGFNWYPDDVKKKPAPQKRSPAPKKDVRKTLREMTELKEVQEEVERLRAVAVMRPTEANIYAYLQANEYILSKSAYFADVARRVVWQNPDVDANAKKPIASYASQQGRDRQKDAAKVNMYAIGKDHGLLFFFRSDCPYCHDMAPVVKALSDSYGVPILAVSMDGGPLPAFPRAKRDNGISAFVTSGRGIQTVPSLYLVSNDKKRVLLVGTGALAADEVTERIRVLLTTKPGEEM